MSDDADSERNSKSVSDDSATCANCGTPIETNDWHPVYTEYPHDNEFRLYLFCDETCRDEWFRD
jgi:hypothetical protein